MKLFTRFNVLVFLIIAMFFVNLFYFLNSNNEPKVDIPKVILEDPTQKLVSDAPIILMEGNKIIPMAEYEIKARILSKRSYDDDIIDISKLDIALGWSDMSNQTLLDNIQITQGNREYNYRFIDSPLTRYNIRTHSSNNHIISANENISKTLSKAKIGELISLKGYLVNLEYKDGRKLLTSLSYEDEYEGSSEVFYVRDVEIIG
jgi:hypothetical protein